MPPFPVADLVVPQTGFALGALQALFDPVFRFGHARELREFRRGGRVGQVVIRLHHFALVAVAKPDHDQDFLVAFLPLVRAPYHAALEELDEQGTFRSLADIERGPGGLGVCR
jgi:hypothetical protein